MSIISNQEDINLYKLMTIASALKLEIKTGMRHSTNAPFKAAKQITGMKTRQSCLSEIQSLIEKAKHEKQPIL
jgi:hypothetical protein